MPDPRFPVIRVSLEADGLIEEYTIDVGTHAQAPQEIADYTYGVMSDSRRRLYEYISKLEAIAGIPAVVTRRFQ